MPAVRALSSHASARPLPVERAHAPALTHRGFPRRGAAIGGTSGGRCRLQAPPERTLCRAFQNDPVDVMRASLALLPRRCCHAAARRRGCAARRHRGCASPQVSYCRPRSAGAVARANDIRAVRVVGRADLSPHGARCPLLTPLLFFVRPDSPLSCRGPRFCRVCRLLSQQLAAEVTPGPKATKGATGARRNHLWLVVLLCELPQGRAQERSYSCKALQRTPSSS